jgi:TonB family protein
MEGFRTQPQGPVMRRDRSLGLPLAVLISIAFHLVAGVAALLWPRAPEEKPQITLDLVDESEGTEAQARTDERRPDEAAKEIAEQLLKAERDKEKRPAEEREKTEQKPEPEKLARVEPLKAPPEPERKPVDLKVVPLPSPSPENAPPPKTEPEKKPEPKKPEEKKPEEKKPEEKKPEPPKPTPLPPELRRMKMVDQDHDKNEPENKEAEFLAQKNRRVEEQTRARDTNLERQSRGERQGSVPSEVQDDQIGGPKEKIAELAEERSHLERKAPPVTPHADEQVPEQRDPRPKNLLSMRDLPRRSHEVTRGAEEEALRRTPDGVLRGRESAEREASLMRREQQARSAGRGKDLRLSLSGHDYDKVVGRDEQERVRRLAQREQSHHKGRWERRWGAIKSSLENFVPEVRPGNQTALNTRAMPFASYIARMHRAIHKLWGFGVLEDWDLKSSSSPLNEMSRWTMVEIVLNGDGTIDKVTVVRPSGYLPFDVAAMDVVLSAAPYPDPPSEIKSANGKIYLHWRFHRDSRQCATFGVDPYILTTPPTGPADKPSLPTNAEEVGHPSAPERGLPTPGAKNRAPRMLRRPVALTDHTYRGPAPEVGRSEEGHEHERAHEHEEPDPEEARRAAARVARADDPAARKVAELWLAAYVRGDLEALTQYSRLPFRSGENYVARKPSELLKLYRTVLDEAPAKRKDSRLEIFSAAGLRGKLGALPRGLDESAGYLFAVARAGNELFVLVLAQEGAGQWKVGGLAR